MSREKTPLYYTFGNHMHWVDMQWLWGYHVMPGSTFDMLRFAEVAGAKGNVNFDGVGYEKLAAEAPEALDALRQAVREGRIEPVGCSYAQPYGLFHGGESNIRHRVYGARAVRRLLGVWPKTFWEEEFDFFPQLPQMLRGCGFEYASLYFQWTWHTPEVPRETVPAVWWEGQDGSRLLTATRNALNLHQWPEDMQILFDQLAAGEQPVTPLGDVPPLILQWVELMPSPDWMCRSEVLLPKLTELLSDVRFEIRPCTLGEYLRLASSAPDIPVRRYSLDDVWHGMSLGKNGSGVWMNAASHERQTLLAESMATINSLYGRPYPQWDVYPVWELEEAWRSLLISQHHDNEECEKLCGHIARATRGLGSNLTANVVFDQQGLLLGRHGLNQGEDPEGDEVAWFRYNACGWPVKIGSSTVPPHGYRIAAPESKESSDGGWNDTGYAAMCGDMGLTLDQDRLEITIHCAGLPDYVVPIGEICYLRDGVRRRLADGQCERTEAPLLGLHISFEDGDTFSIWALLRDGHLNLQVYATVLPDPGFQGALRMFLPAPGSGLRLITDSAYAVHEVEGTQHGLKKYPTGDWMTSEQWFEDVECAFQSLAFVDLCDSVGEQGVQVAHEGSRQWFRQNDDGVWLVLNLQDPWDGHWKEAAWHPEADLFLKPHGTLTHRDRWQFAMERRGTHVVQTKGPVVPTIAVGHVELLAEHSLVTAFYRESEDAGKHVEDYAGQGMGYPTIVRIVEFNGVGETAILKLPGEVAAVYKTNLLGGEPQALATSPTEPPSYSPEGWSWTAIEVPLRPYEIATLYVDLVQARKQTRDLDAKREVWATVHRVE